MRVLPEQRPRGDRARHARVAVHRRRRIDRRPRRRAAERGRRGRGRPLARRSTSRTSRSHSRVDFVETNIAGTLNLLEEAVAAGRRAGSSSRARRARSGGRSTPRRGRAGRLDHRGRHAGSAEHLRHDQDRRRGPVRARSARDHGLPCLILRTSRFFPEPDDRDDVRDRLRRPQHQGQRAALPPGRPRGRRHRPSARARAGAGDRVRPLRDQRDDAVHARTI